MQNRLISFASLFILIAILHVSCSKNDDPAPPAGKTKTELITKASWKFEKATAAGIDISNHPSLACYIDNTITFASVTAIINEGTNVCAPPAQSTPFPWNFTNNEAVLNVSAALLPGGSGDFNIVTLNETNLVVSKDVIIPPATTPVNVVITFKH